VQIDWLTVVAQIVNFLVLIWLLQRFLYNPITRAMAQRESRIGERLASARAAREQAEREAQSVRDQKQELDRRRDEILEQARREAETLRLQLEEEVREDVEQKRRAWHEHLETEKAQFLNALNKRMAGHVFASMRHILSEFADADLALQMAREFVRKLTDLDEDDRDRLMTAARSAELPALVESGIELPAPARAQITKALHERLEAKFGVQYRTDDDLLVGLRLTVGDQSLEWSAGRYLDRLKGLVDEALEAEAVRDSITTQKIA
jgi:F-type H+-transporting ATPase subunit b